VKKIDVPGARNQCLVIDKRTAFLKENVDCSMTTTRLRLVWRRTRVQLATLAAHTRNQ